MPICPFRCGLLPLALSSLVAVPASAQASEQQAQKRTRVILGPQLSPSWPGARDFSVGPYIDVSRARVGEQFAFEAPDESFGSPLVQAGKFAFGPALGFVPKRTATDLGINVPRVGGSFEVGAFVQVDLTANVRVRAEGRKGLSGHKGWTGEISADYVARRGDEWLISLGPRVNLGDGKFQCAYIGVTPDAALSSGLAPFDMNGGIHSVGVTAGVLRQLNRRFGLAAYARYDRLVGRAAESPLVRAAGSRSQPSVGVALSFTFCGDI